MTATIYSQQFGFVVPVQTAKGVFGFGSVIILIHCHHLIYCFSFLTLLYCWKTGGCLDPRLFINIFEMNLLKIFSTCLCYA